MGAALAAAQSVQAPGAPAMIEREIRAVIEAQLAAFRKDDSAAAFSYASPSIQRMFGDPEVFMTMVRSQYPAVYRPRHHEYLEVRLQGGDPVQHMMFVGPGGETVYALYRMELQAHGEWRINGVSLYRPSGQSA